MKRRTFATTSSLAGGSLLLPASVIGCPVLPLAGFLFRTAFMRFARDVAVGLTVNAIWQAISPSDSTPADKPIDGEKVHTADLPGAKVAQVSTSDTTTPVLKDVGFYPKANSAQPSEPVVPFKVKAEDGRLEKMDYLTLDSPLVAILGHEADNLIAKVRPSMSFLPAALDLQYRHKVKEWLFPVPNGKPEYELYRQGDHYVAKTGYKTHLGMVKVGCEARNYMSNGSADGEYTLEVIQDGTSIYSSQGRMEDLV